MRHDSPHPAEIMDGSGMIRPGISCFRQVFSMAMALVVVLNVMMIYSFFSLMISYLQFRSWLYDQGCQGHFLRDYVHIRHLTDSKLVRQTIMIQTCPAGEYLHTRFFHSLKIF